jgi:phenylalanyl-tRNA synthetase alpha chain
MYVLTEEGKTYLREGLPEKNLIELLKKGPLSLHEAKNRIKHFNIALLWAKKNGWIKVEKGVVILTNTPKKIEQQEALESIDKGHAIEKNVLEILIKRDLVEKERESLEVKAKRRIGKEITNLTEDLIKTRMWKKVKLKPYNVTAVGKRIYPGKKHILTAYADKIRRIFLDLGFEEAYGPLIESSFWNFDALYQPQDHPARELADTFYMKTPKTAKLPNRKIVESVKKTHEDGWITESSGWEYEWDEDIAKRPILRTHTTAVSARYLANLKPPAKIFCVDRVFRNETIDYKHLPEFTQVEGIVVDYDVSFKDLLGYLKEFYLRLGFKKIRFAPSYFPYTEMSVQPEVYFENKKEWLEMGGAGIFRPEVTKPLGIDCPVLAWGLSLERPIMLKLGINDIRQFYYVNDLKILRNVVLWQ